MTHPCCTQCRLHFHDAAELDGMCPRCDGPVERRPASAVLGFQRFEPSEPGRSISAALADALTRPPRH